MCRWEKERGGDQALSDEGFMGDASWEGMMGSRGGCQATLMRAVERSRARRSRWVLVRVAQHEQQAQGLVGDMVGARFWYRGMGRVEFGGVLFRTSESVRFKVERERFWPLWSSWAKRRLRVQKDAKTSNKGTVS